MADDADEVWAVTRPDAQELVKEWDLLAERRRQEISDGLDTSFTNALLPAVKEEVRLARSRYVEAALIDIGCGTGELTAELKPLVQAVVGIDPSARSIALARELAPDLVLRQSSLSSFAAGVPSLFQIAVASMVMMNVTNLESFVADVGRVLEPAGTFVATVTHPWTWSHYWAYEQAPWFDYERELFIRARWKVSGVEVAAPQVSTHVHRPLSRYVQALSDAGLVIRGIREFGRTTRTRSGCDVDKPFPRFLLFTAERRG